MKKIEWRRVLVLTALVGLFCSGCGPALHFRRATVVGAEKDEKTQSTLVQVSFEVWLGDEQLKDLGREAFQVYEDGQPATSEALSDAATDQVKVPVALVLDNSLSMYDAKAVDSLKKAAADFVTSLESGGFEVTVYRFATKIERLTSVSEIPDAFDAEEGERWTSLYAAVNTAFGDNPRNIVVVFSDGADNYSANHGVPNVHWVASHVVPTSEGGIGTQRVVHAIGFGNVEAERDKQGVAAVDALRQISRNGSLQMAESEGALQKVFSDIASRIRSVYMYEYYSPSLRGRHQLVVEVSARGQKAQTEVLFFTPVSSAAVDRAPLNKKTKVEGPTKDDQLVLQLMQRLALDCKDPASESCELLAQKITKTQEAMCAQGSKPCEQLTLVMAALRSRQQWQPAAEACQAGPMTACDAARRKAIEDSTSACEKGAQATCARIASAARTLGEKALQPKAEAVAKWRTACDAGNVRSCLALASFYRDGWGVPQDKAKAVETYKRHCDAGDGEACAGLGSMMLLGDGTEANLTAAHLLFQKAEEKRYAAAPAYLSMVRLIRLAEDEEANAADLKALREMCAVGHPTSCHFLREWDDTGKPPTSIAPSR